MSDGKEVAPSLVAATDRIRETAKWMTISLAAIGGVLAAGSQLSDVGSLALWSGRFWASIVGGVFATLGILGILVAAVWTATTQSLTLQELAAAEKQGVGKKGSSVHFVSRWLNEHNQRILGWKDLSELSDKYIEVTSEKRDKYEAYLEAIATERSDKQVEYEIAAARFVGVNHDAQLVLRAAMFESVAYRWRRSCLVMAIGGLLVALGIGTFAWASNPPPKAVASSASPNLLTTPQRGTLTLTDEGRTALGCNAPTVPVLVLAKTEAGPDVLLQPEPGVACKAVRVLVAGESWGRVQQ